MRRRKELEIWLSQISGFSNPKYMLEQYPTSPELSLDILLLIQSKYGDIEGQVICDLGCGTGRLGLGCLALGAERVIGIDVDQEALEIAKDNARDLFEDEDLCNLEWRNLDVVELAGIEQLEKEVDVVVMNPPFGTRNSGVDLLFVQVGLKLAKKAVYSLHKTSTRSGIVKKAKMFGCDVQVIAELKFDVPQMYKFHREKSKDIVVDLIRFSW